MDSWAQNSLDSLSVKDSVLRIDSIAKADSVIFNPLDTLKGIDSLRYSLVMFAKTFLNKPYCYSGKGNKCFDCSGLMQRVFSTHNIVLPPSSTTQAVCGNFIAPLNAKPGDLIFFNGRRANSEDIGHVGMVIEVTETEVYFIHASVQSGVIISCLSENYYAQRFMCVKNVLEVVD